MPRLPSSDSGPALYWRLMRTLQQHFGHFTSPVLQELAGTGNRKTIEHYLAFLRKEGVVELCRAIRHNGDALQYRIVRDGEAPPARRLEGSEMGLRQQSMWNAMRGLRSFSPAELAMTASTEQLKIASETARSFVFDLKAAGYVAPIGEGRYRLLPAKNTGPRAPIILRGRGVFDLNLMRSVNVTAQPDVQHDGRAA